MGFNKLKSLGIALQTKPYLELKIIRPKDWLQLTLFLQLQELEVRTPF